MKSPSAALVACIGLLVAGNCFAQSTNANGQCNCYGDLAEATNAIPAEKATTAAAPAQSGLNEAEAKFAALLKEASLTGRWASTRDNKLGEERTDTYKIVSAVKVSGDSWVVNASMKYRDREFVVPVPVKMNWANDVAVLSVTDLGMPGGNTKYTARVMFYGNEYSGTWSGGRGGGLLYGIISNGTGTNKVEAASAPTNTGN
jgi:hypothetical protein